MPRQTGQWKKALVAFTAAPAGVLFAADLKAAGVTDPTRTVAELNQRRGYRVEEDGTDWTEHERGTRYVFHGKRRKGITTDRSRPRAGGASEEPEASPRVPGPDAPPAGEPKAVGPTYTETTLDYTGRGPKPVENIRVVERTGAEGEPSGPGVLAIVPPQSFLDRVLADQLYRRRVLTGREFLPEVKAELKANPGATTELICAECSTRRPEPGECPNCGCELVATVAVKLPPTSAELKAAA